MGLKWVDRVDILGGDSHLFSPIVLFEHQLFPHVFFFFSVWFSREKDPWKEWKWKLPLETRQPHA